LAVRKTYKLYVGGAFPRSESGRSYEVTGADGTFLGNAALASRKDARDAVRAARGAVSGWSGATAYNRGQVLYRVAEMLEGRRDQFIAEVRAVEGGSAARAARQVDAAIDRWVWYAGWSDKLAQTLGAINPVAGPFWSVSSPTPTGVVAAVAPERPTLLGLVSVIAPIAVAGNSSVVIVPGDTAPVAVALAEVLATSDLPGGVINLLSGRVAEVLPHLATHLDVNGLDLTGAGDPEIATAAEASAADSLKRVTPPAAKNTDWYADPGTGRLSAFLETRTVWHPVGV
jgi:acyl-CoA reductase-like NAD-dependent aldehyde dehydrogenase